MFEIRLGEDARRELRRLRAFVRRRITTAMRRELTHQPMRDASPRKRLAPDTDSGIAASMPLWQLRVGDYRVFYDVDAAAGVVLVQRVVHKGRLTTRKALQ